ncbi:MAG: AMIN domain-containing protein [Richelia sp. SM1_7_0]|nr:AMIN domain-containing protein [Richelia sp. SM1_7_0]
MNQLHLLKNLGMASAIVILATQPVLAELEKATEGTAKSPGLSNDIPRLTDIKFPSTSVQQLTQATTGEITGVSVTPTKEGLEVILETKQGEKLQVKNISEDNNFIVDVPNTQLKLSGENLFRQQKPIKGITEITVVNQDTNTVRLTLKGETALPKVELFDGNEGLVFRVTPATSSTQNPTPTTPDKPQAENQEQEAIELTVTGEQDSYRVNTASTATKLSAPQRDLPISIQVIPREVIEDRQVLRLNELADNVAGVQQETGYGSLTLSRFQDSWFYNKFWELTQWVSNNLNQKLVNNLKLELSKSFLMISSQLLWLYINLLDKMYLHQTPLTPISALKQVSKEVVELN